MTPRCRRCDSPGIYSTVCWPRIGRHDPVPLCGRCDTEWFVFVLMVVIVGTVETWEARLGLAVGGSLSAQQGVWEWTP